MVDGFLDLVGTLSHSFGVSKRKKKGTWATYQDDRESAPAGKESVPDRMLVCCTERIKDWWIEGTTHLICSVS